MQFGRYLTARPSEIEAISLPRELGASSNLSRALLICPLELKRTTEKIIEVLEVGKDSEASLKDAMAFLVNAHASSVVSGNRANVQPKVATAHQIAHQLDEVPQRFCAHTTRFLAREAVKAQDYEEAQRLLALIEKERDPAESTPQDPAFISDRLELGIVNLCVPYSQREAHGEIILQRLLESQFRNLADALYEIEMTPEGVRAKIAADMLWLTYHYARHPLLSSQPLQIMCAKAQEILGGLDSDKGVLESIKILSAFAVEQGDFAKAGQLLTSALTQPSVVKDPTLQIEFLHSAGQALKPLGGASYESSVELMTKALQIATLNSQSFSLFYRLELVELLLEGWQIDRAKQVFSEINHKSASEEDCAIRYQYLMTKASLLILQGSEKRGLELMQSVKDESTSSIINEDDLEQYAALGLEERRDLVHKLNRVAIRERLPILVKEFESGRDFDVSAAYEQLDSALTEELTYDLSPWTAELLFRVDLAHARRSRLNFSSVERVSSLQRSASLIVEFPKLKNSLCLAELLLERGLALVIDERDASAVEALEGCLVVASRFGKLGDGVRWAANCALSKIYELSEADSVRSSEYAKEAIQIERQIYSGASSLFDLRQTLAERYKVAEAFTYRSNIS